MTTLPHLPATPEAHVPDFTRTWSRELAGKSPNTLRAYGVALRRFETFLRHHGIDVGAGSPADLARYLLGGSTGHASETAAEFKRWMLEVEGLSAATVNVALSALRMLGRVARASDASTARIECRGARGTSERRPAPTVGDVVALLEAAKEQGGALGLRDVALVHLLAVRGLRLSEAVGLDLGDVDEGACAVRVRRKGSGGVGTWETVAGSTMGALVAWTRELDHDEGPVFVALDRVSGPESGRLSKRGAAKVVERLCEEIGRHGARAWTPHELRAAATTIAARETGGDLGRVAVFAAHRSVSTTMRYVREAEDVGGRVAASVADAVARASEERGRMGAEVTR